MLPVLQTSLMAKALLRLPVNIKVNYQQLGGFQSEVKIIKVTEASLQYH